MLVNSNGILFDAFKKGYAIPAYNINDFQSIKYVLEACDQDKSPVILSFSEKAVIFFGGYKVVFNVVKTLASSLNVSIPFVIHLDHAKSYEDCKKAIDAGFTSVMYDGSSLSLEENIGVTNQVLEYAKEKDVSVEAQVGNIDDPKELSFEDVTSFSLRTDVNSLSVFVGNKHGFYEQEPNINFELMGAVCKEVKKPLVLHGGSFLNDNMIKTAIFCGVCKINIDTELQYAWTNAIRNYLNYNKDECNIRNTMNSLEKDFKKVIYKKNILFDSKFKAN